MRSDYREEIECPNEIEYKFPTIVAPRAAVEWTLILTTVMSEGVFMTFHVGLPLVINSRPL